MANPSSYLQLPRLLEDPNDHVFDAAILLEGLRFDALVLNVDPLSRSAAGNDNSCRTGHDTRHDVRHEREFVYQSQCRTTSRPREWTPHNSYSDMVISPVF